MRRPAPDGRLIDAELKLAGRLDERFFALLSAIDATGSINRAARTAGLSYKGAWLILETASNLAQSPLVETATGGAGGGGTTLTGPAVELLAVYRELQSAHHEFLRRQEARLAGRGALAKLLRRLSMKTSARNQFAGVVAKVDLGPVSAEVVMSIGEAPAVAKARPPRAAAAAARPKAAIEIVAAMTSTSAKRLKLARGREVVALVKASEVVLVTDFAGWQVSARNQLEGVVSRLERGAVNSIVVLTLPGGAAVTSTITNAGLDALGLAVGTPATAVFNAYAVTVAARP